MEAPSWYPHSVVVLGVVLDLGIKGRLMFNFVMSFNFMLMLNVRLHARWMMNCMSPVFSRIAC